MKFFVSAGEVSGDIHGAYLVSEMLRLSPVSSFFGIGSESLSSLGVDIRLDISRRGTIGLIEAVPNIVSLYTSYLEAKKMISSERPDAAIFIDSQGFNLPLASYCRGIGIKTIYYIPPQEWLWGGAKGVRKVAASVDMIVSIFAKEHEIYVAAGANSIYFGHPLIDIVKPVFLKEETRSRFGFSGNPLICVCPGSRKQEIKNIFPLLLDAATIIKKDQDGAQLFLLSAASWVKEEINSVLLRRGLEIKVLDGPKYDLINASDLVLASSGTINLESSILGTPNVMAYKLDPATYFIAKRVLRLDRKLKYYSMPNILLDSYLVPEFTQERAVPALIASSCSEILLKRGRLDNAPLLRLLGGSPVIPKIADSILRFTAG